MATGDFKKYHIERLRDSKEAALYLDMALEEYQHDDNYEAFLQALRDVAESQGGMSKLAGKAKLGRTSLYKALSLKGNPRNKTLFSIIKSLGFKIKLEPLNNLHK